MVQPEVIANAVYAAVRHPRREYWIGLSTLKVILGNMVLPGWLDRYLAKRAFAAQETEEPVTNERVDNLMVPVRALHRTRGRFGKEAQDRAVIADGPVARVLPLAVGALTVLVAGLLIGASQNRRPRRNACFRNQGGLPRYVEMGRKRPVRLRELVDSQSVMADDRGAEARSTRE